MQIGDSKTMLMLEAAQINLVYLPTTHSGYDVDLKAYSLVFKRLSLIEVENFLAHYAGIAPFFLIVGVVAFFGMCTYCFFYKRHYETATH